MWRARAARMRVPRADTFGTPPVAASRARYARKALATLTSAVPHVE